MLQSEALWGAHELQQRRRKVALIVRLGCSVEAMMRRLPTLRPRAGMEVLPTDRLASRSRLDTSPLQFALDDIESHLKREHGERRPTDDRGSRQDQKRRHLNLSNVAKRKWERQKGRSCDQERYAVCVNSGEPDAALDCPCMTMHTIRAASATEIVLSAIAKNAKAPLLIHLPRYCDAIPG